DLVLLNRTSEANDVGDARDHLELAFHSPVLDGAKLLGGQSRAFQTIAKNFADGSGKRCEFGLHTWRQVSALQSFQDLLARKVIIHFVVEGKHEERESELSVREHAH